MRYFVPVLALLIQTQTTFADDLNPAKIFFRDKNGQVFAASAQGNSISYKQAIPGEIEALPKGQVRLNRKLYHLSTGSSPYIEIQEATGAWDRINLDGTLSADAKIDVDGAGNLYISTPRELYSVNSTSHKLTLLKNYTGSNAVADPAKGGLIYLKNGEIYEVSNPEGWSVVKTRIELSKAVEKIERLDNQLLFQTRYDWGLLPNDGPRSHAVKFHDYRTADSKPISSLTPEESALYKRNFQPSISVPSAMPETPLTAVSSTAVFNPDDYMDRTGQVDSEALYSAHRMSRENRPVIEGPPELNAKKPKEFAQGIVKMKKDLRYIISGQDHVVDAMVDLVGEVERGVGEKQHRVLLLTGPTGSGKTFSAETLVEYVFKKKAQARAKNFLVIQGNTIKSDADVWKLLGATTGHIGSDKTKGILPEFIDNAVEGEPKYIVLNEAEKMLPSAWEALMEFLDKGKLDAGDGKVRNLGKGMIILTSNKGSEEIFPKKGGGSFTPAQMRKRMEGFTDEKITELFVKPDPNDLDNAAKIVPRSVMNRIDRAVGVPPVTKAAAMTIARVEADQISDKMMRQNGYTVQLDDDTITEVINKSFAPEDGVRRPKKVISSLISRAETEGSMELDANDAHQFMVSPRTSDDGEKLEFVVRDIANPGKDTIVPMRLSRAGFDSLNDAEQRTLLKNLDRELKKRVFGQDKAIDAVATSVRARAVNPKIKTPVKIGLFGSSGTGKTELGESLAEVIHGDRERSKVISMGDINRVEDLSNIFGSARGYSGSTSLTAFEQFLVANPEGGVVIFDEFGNAGVDAAQKEAIQTRIYDMLDRGRYSTQHGEEIDLKKFIFVMTSNQGEELFKGMPSDDLRMAAYEPMKNSKTFQEYLKEQHHYKEALINRLDGNVILMKPILREDRIEISKKLIGGQISAMRDHVGLRHLEVPEDFHARMGELFFSHEGGSRAIRSVAENEVANLFTAAALDDEISLKALQNAKIHLDVHDSHAKAKMIARGKHRNEPRSVKVTLKVETESGFKKTFEVELVEKAASKKIYSSAVARKIAFHEAGHTVVNLPDMTEQEVKFVTIKGAGNYGGYARYEMRKDVMSLNRENIVHRVAGILAGSETQRAFGFGVDSGWSGDIEQSWKLAQAAVANYGLTDRALDLPVKDGKVLIEHPLVQEEINRVLREGEALAKKRISSEFASIVAVANELMRKGDVDEARLVEIMKASATPEYKKQTANFLYKRDQRLKNRSIPTDSCIVDTLQRTI